MKIIVVCLIGILICSCCRNTDDTMKRQAEIIKILKDHYSSYDYTFEVRGPLTIEQFEKESITLYEESSEETRERANDLGETFEASQEGRNFARLKSRYKEGDELYFFTSDERSWNDLHGKKGYVIIQKNRIVDMKLIAIN